MVKSNGENPYSNPSPKPHFYPLIWQQIRMNNLSLNLAPDCGVQYSSSRNVFGSERVAFSDPLRLYLHVTCARISDYTLSERARPIAVFFVLNLIGENQWWKSIPKSLPQPTLSSTDLAKLKFEWIIWVWIRKSIAKFDWWKSIPKSIPQLTLSPTDLTNSNSKE